MTRQGDEQQQAREWVFARLSQDPTLAGILGVPTAALVDHVWPDLAPDDVDRRWIVYSAQTGFDVNPVGAYPRLVVPVPVNVRAICTNEDTAWAYQAARRIYELIHGNWNHPGLSGAMILTGQRQATLDYPEVAGGIRYRHVGGIYTVQVN